MNNSEFNYAALSRISNSETEIIRYKKGNENNDE